MIITGDEILSSLKGFEIGKIEKLSPRSIRTFQILQQVRNVAIQRSEVILICTLLKISPLKFMKRKNEVILILYPSS